MSIALPQLSEPIAWSIRITTLDGEVLAEHEPDRVSKTASVGKVFLLIELARQIREGKVAADALIDLSTTLRVADSGLAYRFTNQSMAVADAALLVGTMSDNLATNALIDVCGLERVHAIAGELGYTQTAQLDYIRDDRGPEHPWTPSYGTAAELSDLMRRLANGEVLSPEISQQVLDWLASDTDTSMVADALLLDPLAHVEPEYQSMVLRHKTGTIEQARIDVGVLQGPQRSVAYAVAANWPEEVPDQRAVALDTMREIGEQIRRYVTDLDRDDPGADSSD